LNIEKLFEAQRKLDERIVKEKGLENDDLLDKRILALQVELGELAQNWRGFKFWSDNQTAITLAARKTGNGKGETYNPLLEEYVDCLHFILSIGNDTVPDTSKAERFIHPKKMPNILDQFMWTNKKIVDMYEDYRDKKIPSTGYHFTHVFSAIWGLGEMLGFTWEQIEQAYFAKNKINHERQETGY